MPQEQAAHPRHDKKFFEQLVRQVVDGPVDQLAAVVDGNDLDAGRKALLKFFSRRDGQAISDRARPGEAGGLPDHARQGRGSNQESQSGNRRLGVGDE